LVGATPSKWNFGSTGPRWSEIADFEPIFARSASAVASREKSSINTNRKSTMRFLISLGWSSYVAPKSPKGGSKTIKKADFGIKLHFDCRKSDTKFPVSLCDNCQRQSCKAFVGLTYPCVNHSTWNFFGPNWPRWCEIADIRSIFVRSASAVTSSEKKFN